MKIHLQIDRLVLDGLSISSRDATLLQTALERELARRLAAASGAPAWRSTAVHVLEAPALPLEGASSAADLGERLAGVIDTSLGTLR